MVSAPLLPSVKPALARSPWVKLVLEAALDGSLAAEDGTSAAHDFAYFLARAPVEPDAAPTSADEVAFWLYSSGSTGAPKGVKHVHSSLRATAETYGTQVLGIAPDDLVFSAAKLFFAYGLGNAMTFPMSVGAAAALLPDRPTPDCRAGHDARAPADRLRRRAHPLRRAARPPRARARRRIGPAAALHLRRRGAARSMSGSAGRRSSASTSSTASARPRCSTSS